MSDVNKIVTIEQLKKATQDYHSQIVKKKILDNIITDSEVDSLYNDYFDSVSSGVENLEMTLSELNSSTWLDGRI